jgi:tetratricopeptide (TPR) repeat protein
MSVARSSAVSLLCAATVAIATTMAGSALADPPPVAPPVPAPRPREAADKDDGPKEALSLHDEAWALYEQGRYRAAIERLEGALRLDPEGRELVYNLGVIHEKLADFHTAAAYYRRYVEMETDPKARTRALATLKRVEGAEKEATPPLAVATSGPVAPRADLVYAPSAGRRTATIALGGVAAAAFTTGLGCGLAAVVRNPGDGARTGGTVTVQTLEDDARAAHTEAIIADVAFVVAAAATATALLVHYTAPRVVASRATSGALGVKIASRGLAVTF